MKKHKVKIRIRTKIAKGKKRKNVLVKTTISLVIIAFLGFTINKTVKFLLTSPIFNVKSIEVNSSDIIEKDVVLGYLDFEGKNIFRIPLKKIRLLLKEKFPVIEKVAISRRLPDKIVTKVIERIPLAECKISDRRIGIDKSCKKFILPDRYNPLPRISENLTTENEKACLDFLHSICGLPVSREIKGITAVATDDVIFFLEDDCKVCIGSPENIDYKITYLEKVLADIKIKGKKAKYVNMRNFSDEYKEIVLRTQ